MATKCRYCGSSHVIKYGKTKAGKQIYFCKSCNRYWVKDGVFHRYPKEIRKVVVRTVLEGKPVKEVSKEFSVPATTIYKWLRKEIEGEINENKKENQLLQNIR
ncbi:transposase-like zinc-binding domain-containing protein [Stygiolobus caldivivus]|uniref:IS1 family transposase n=1 Tax=Stygiolobus caldivivus TaxID=2824673 RepID=A0A8D5U4G7_9CREN|nr:transposase [Stygiolobus caldivivus]BCU68887.1 hypothetical protein KN1_01840 [Stygiolobus caldivivus]